MVLRSRHAEGDFHSDYHSYTCSTLDFGYVAQFFDFVETEHVEVIDIGLQQRMGMSNTTWELGVLRTENKFEEYWEHLSRVPQARVAHFIRNMTILNPKWNIGCPRVSMLRCNSSGRQCLGIGKRHSRLTSLILILHPRLDH